MTLIYGAPLQAQMVSGQGGLAAHWGILGQQLDPAVVSHREAKNVILLTVGQVREWSDSLGSDRAFLLMQKPGMGSDVAQNPSSYSVVARGTTTELQESLNRALALNSLLQLRDPSMRHHFFKHFMEHRIARVVIINPSQNGGKEGREGLAIADRDLVGFGLTVFAEMNGVAYPTRAIGSHQRRWVLQSDSVRVPPYEMGARAYLETLPLHHKRAYMEAMLAVGERNFSELFLSGADLRRFDLRGVNFRRAHLGSANLRGAIVDETTDFDGAEVGGLHIHERYLPLLARAAEGRVNVFDNEGWHTESAPQVGSGRWRNFTFYPAADLSSRHP